MIDKIIEVGGRRWKVRQAKSIEHAMDAIVEARVSGSVGCKNVVNRTYLGGCVEVLADVVEINSDGTERKPYTERY